MSEYIRAIYEKSVLRPLQPLDLPENKIVYYHPGANNLPLVIIAMFRKDEKLVLGEIIEILIHGKIGQTN